MCKLIPWHYEVLVSGFLLMYRTYPSKVTKIFIDNLIPPVIQDVILFLCRSAYKQRC